MSTTLKPPLTADTLSKLPLSPDDSTGRIIWMTSDWRDAGTVTEQLRRLGIEVREVNNILLALGMIAEFNPEVLWLDSLDHELTLDEILDALRIPRRINPLAVVLSSTLAQDYPRIQLGPSDEILNCDDIQRDSTLLLQFIKVTQLERQVIQREYEILNSLPHALLVADGSLNIWNVNKKVEQLLEISDPEYRKKALGRRFGLGLAAAGLPADENGMPLPRLVSELENAIKNRTSRFRIKEVIGGSERLLRCDITPLVENPDNFLIDLRDITADEQAVLVEARRERLATIGNLSVGVAHEIQNPNTFSRVNAANLKMMFSAIKPLLANASLSTQGKIGNMSADVFFQKASEAIDAVDMASRRIDEVLGTLKTFGRSDDGKLEALNILQVVNEAVILTKHEARGKAEVIVDVAEDLPLVTGTRTGLSQVLVNLIQNAVYALAENKSQTRGASAARITIKTEAVNDEEVVVSVSDNGPGVPDTLREKIFRPYFTTKPQGQGTGLGLSISTDMLHRFGGDLTLKSQAGEGATFFIKLRRHEESPDHS